MQIFTNLPVKHILRNLPCKFFKEKRQIKAAFVFQKNLDLLEQNTIDANHEIFSKSDVMINSLKRFKSKKTADKINQISLRVMALKYRCKMGLKGFSNEDKLTGLATEWKQKSTDPNKALSEVEVDQIKEACKYCEFSNLLILDKNLREDFFKWAIRDCNNVKAFVYYPATCKKLKCCLLSGRIGRLSKETLKLQKRDGKRVLTLPFEVGKNKSEEINILDEDREVTLRKKIKLTVNDILQEFADKNFRPGDIEIFGVNGITNWNTHLLGRKTPDGYKLIDLDTTDSEYWKEMPIFEELTEADILQRYGTNPDFTKKEWLACVKSTREHDDLDIDRSHGYMDVLIPSEKEGIYNLFPFGKFASKFPTGIVEKSYFVTDTVVAKIEYPDENSFYAHRQQALVPFVISEEKGYELMEDIRKDLVQSRKDNVVFQFSWENCAYWPQIRIEKLLKDKEKVPLFFNAHLLDSYPRALPLKLLFKFLRKLPGKTQLVVMKLFRYPFRCKRGVWVEEEGKKIFKSSMHSPFAQKFNIYLPSVLHVRIAKNEIIGKVLYGNSIYRR